MRSLKSRPTRTALPVLILLIGALLALPGAASATRITSQYCIDLDQSRTPPVEWKHPGWPYEAGYKYVCEDGGLPHVAKQSAIDDYSIYFQVPRGTTFSGLIKHVTIDSPGVSLDLAGLPQCSKSAIDTYLGDGDGAWQNHHPVPIEDPSHPFGWRPYDFPCDTDPGNPDSANPTQIGAAVTSADLLVTKGKSLGLILNGNPNDRCVNDEGDSVPNSANTVGRLWVVVKQGEPLGDLHIKPAVMCADVVQDPTDGHLVIVARFLPYQVNIAGLSGDGQPVGIQYLPYMFLANGRDDDGTLLRDELGNPLLNGYMHSQDTCGQKVVDITYINRDGGGTEPAVPFFSDAKKFEVTCPPNTRPKAWAMGFDPQSLPKWGAPNRRLTILGLVNDAENLPVPEVNLYYDEERVGEVQLPYYDLDQNPGTEPQPLSLLPPAGWPGWEGYGDNLGLYFVSPKVGQGIASTSLAVPIQAVDEAGWESTSTTSLQVLTADQAGSADIPAPKNFPCPASQIMDYSKDPKIVASGWGASEITEESPVEGSHGTLRAWVVAVPGPEGERLDEDVDLYYDRKVSKNFVPKIAGNGSNYYIYAKQWDIPEGTLLPAGQYPGGFVAEDSVHQRRSFVAPCLNIYSNERREAAAYGPSAQEAIGKAMRLAAAGKEAKGTPAEARTLARLLRAGPPAPTGKPGPSAAATALLGQIAGDIPGGDAQQPGPLGPSGPFAPAQQAAGPATEPAAQPPAKLGKRKARKAKKAKRRAHKRKAHHKARHRH